MPTLSRRQRIITQLPTTTAESSLVAIGSTWLR